MLLLRLLVFPSLLRLVTMALVMASLVSMWTIRLARLARLVVEVPVWRLLLLELVHLRLFWDDASNDATGGGVSVLFPGRDVPDVAGNADPDTGYMVLVDGEKEVFGGTSCVAPLYLGLYLRLLELTNQPFDFVSVVAGNATVCFDVTSGTNGAYRAGPGRDEVTGFGVVDGTLLLNVLKASTPPPVTPPPVTPPPVTPSC